jgi:hypothetical protein
MLLFVCAAIVGGSWALQSEPAAIPNDITATTSALNESQRKVVSEYLDYWIGRLASENPAEVAGARGPLDKPLRAIGTTGVFRSEYSRLVIERITPLLSGPSDLVATNAMIVLSFCKTPEAVDLLVRQTEVRTQPREDRRLAAASVLLKSISAVALTPTKAGAVAGQIAANCRNEASWLVLQQELDLLAAMARMHPTIFTVQVQALADVVSRIDRQTAPDQLMQALSWSLVGLRDQFLAKPVGDQRTDGPKLEPVLLALLKTIDRHWEAAQKNPLTSRAYGDAIQRGEQLLKQISNVLGRKTTPTSPPLHDAWRSNDRGTYSAGVKAWESSIKSS